MISQREARKLRKRVAELENILQRQKRAFTSEWPSSVSIARLIPSDVHMACIKTARKLDHAVVVVPDGNELVFFASVLPKV